MIYQAHTQPVVIGSDIEFGRMPGGAVLSVQPFLLDFANYNSAIGAVDQTHSREFYVTGAAVCRGVRLEATAVTTITIVLYQVSTGALVTSRIGMTTAVGENLLLFNADVSLVVDALYRVGIYGTQAGRMTYWAGAIDHPDSALVILTEMQNCWAEGDVYPGTYGGAYPVAIEPIIAT